uniref:Uncharacterized protein n=1 Tax=Pipistrellus kuhlii TaxID=59472 RepID=A0A7J7UA38_PIPKU|nr:hypothetical protein mPipKuh1_009154 [Pipistrellus kuhlii]
MALRCSAWGRQIRGSARPAQPPVPAEGGPSVPGDEPVCPEPPRGSPGLVSGRWADAGTTQSRAGALPVRGNVRSTRGLETSSGQAGGHLTGHTSVSRRGWLSPYPGSGQGCRHWGVSHGQRGD